MLMLEHDSKYRTKIWLLDEERFHSKVESFIYVETDVELRYGQAARGNMVGNKYHGGECGLR